MADETLGRSATREAWDLLPLYALDALDDLERRQVDRLLADDADARRALDEYRETVGAFVVDTEPPAELRAATLAAIGGATSDDGANPYAAVDPSTGDRPGHAADVAAGPEGSNVVSMAAARERRKRSWRLAAVAAVAVVAVGVPTGIAVDSRQTQVRLEAQATRVADMLADPDARLVTSTVAGGGEASALVSGGDVLFTASGLPEAADDEDYQLWIVAEAGITSAGLLDTSDAVSQALVEGADGEVVAMTLEPEGGSDQPTSDPIVALET
ncbi:hypothetical protein GCM10025865_18400 [Paraoerskovia sediminicola]|uniref:Regulator of SigK n=1 Tax=Paraoerskovia sediminicola TaxID=1138587 RepID=A0ABN6XG17_9CELL|nr:anti-sigma factor [Paraoerskovia sediminicola]BDZ42541.1 hypothetical protein GCM10025865_18400 [Paraoerskovia sediminicola]